MLKKEEKLHLQGILTLLEDANIKYEIKFFTESTGETIVEYADENSFDCLVIGSRGLNRFQSMVLGGVSHKVTKGAKCPVMIVK
ncbi:universal stress protein [Anaerobacillus sp. HL2]|nr:universal stress protein [Anaerobacillus sp. HL2]